MIGRCSSQVLLCDASLGISPHMKTPRNVLAAVGICGILLSFTACEDKPSKPSATAPKASEQAAIVDPAIAEAIAAGAASEVSPGEGAEREGGPPASGVFRREQADAVHAVGASVFLEVGTLGSEPRVSLKPMSYDVPKTLSFTVATTLGARRSMPTVDLDFGLSVVKPKEKPVDGVPMKSMPATSKVTLARLSAQQPGQVPADVAKEIAKLKDSKIEWSFEPGGGVRISALERSAAALVELESNLTAVAEALAVSCIPAPDEPVGVGATWIARSRDVYGGLDLVSYRVAKVTKIEGDVVTVVVETRQYSAGSEHQMAGLPEGPVVQLESVGNGEVLLHLGRRFPEKVSYIHDFVIGVMPSNATENQIAQIGRRTTTTFPVSK